MTFTDFQKKTMKWKIDYSNSAKKYLKALSKPDRERIKSAVDKLRDGPYHRRDLDIKPLRASDNWRLRVGKYRVIFNIEDNKIHITIVEIGSRGDVYK